MFLLTQLVFLTATGSNPGHASVIEDPKTGLQTYAWSLDRGKKHYEVVMSARALHLGHGPLNPRGIVFGKPANGAEATMPATQFSTVAIVEGDKQFLVPRRLISDCFVPHLGTDLSKPEVKLLPNGKLKIVVEGADGVASYTLTLTVSPNGQVTRHIEGSL